MKNGKLKPGAVMTPLAVVLFNIIIIVFPRDAIQAAGEGAALWFNGVLPALLPFAVGVNIITALGLTRLAGAVLEPLTRKLFRAPGKGGFVLTAGLLSGYPMGAKTAAALRERGEITKRDADKLICFVNNAGPPFILGVAAEGMFHNRAAGWYLICAHIASALAAGFLFRFLPGGGKGAGPLERPKPAETESFGRVLSKSVMDGMESMLMIGGFIIVFSVIVRVLSVTKVFGFLESALTSAFPWGKGVFGGILAGALEMTNGLKLVAECGPTRPALVASAAIITFGGFSVHAQAIGFLSKTDISASLYLLAKTAQTALSVVFGLALMPFFYESIVRSGAVETFKPESPGNAPFRILLRSALCFAAMAAFFILIVIIGAIKRGRKPKRRRRF